MARAKALNSKTSAPEIAKLLKREYPSAKCALEFSNPLELLIATILSAQCTDVRVNMVTPALFKKYRHAGEFAAAKQTELEKLIQSTGFFRNKAKSIIACCQKIVELHQGQVPQVLAQLVELPGVGRKTANVVLGTAYGVASGVVVDTHVGRLSHRLGLTKHKDPVKIERDLMAQLPAKEWVNFSHRLIHHGRKICTARKPHCDECILNVLCPKIGVTTKAVTAANPGTTKRKSAKKPRKQK